MVWIYVLILLLFLVTGIVYRIKDINEVRVFGFELLRLILYFMLAIVILGEFLIPMPQYYIKKGIGDRPTLDEVLQEEVLKSGINFDEGSFRILDSHGMHFNHLFLTSYRLEGKEEVRILPFEKNIFGNMKPKESLNKDYYIITDLDNERDYYVSDVKDGIFAAYRVVAGFGTPPTEIRHILNDYVLEDIHPSGYFMWIEMVREPWKTEIVKLLVLFIVSLITSKTQGKREPSKFYSKWYRGEKIFKYVKNINSKFL